MHFLRFCSPLPSRGTPHRSIILSANIFPSWAAGTFPSWENPRECDHNLLLLTGNLVALSYLGSSLWANSSYVFLMIPSAQSLLPMPVSTILLSLVDIWTALTMQATTIPKVVLPRPSWELKMHSVLADEMVKPGKEPAERSARIVPRILPSTSPLYEICMAQ